METSELVHILKEWVAKDAEYKVLQRELKKRRDDAKSLTQRLMKVMRDNEIDVFDIKDGRIIYKKSNQKRPLSQKTLNEILLNFYRGDDTKASELQTYIQEHRQVKTVESIKLQPPKANANANANLQSETSSLSG
jgi:Family of unknown function (DUF5760)